LIKSKELEEYVLGLNGFIKTCISKRGWGNTWNIILYWDELISKSIAQKLI
jgi:PhoPQ-activated pathogenicity-related protein